LDNTLSHIIAQCKPRETTGLKTRAAGTVLRESAKTELCARCWGTWRRPCRSQLCQVVSACGSVRLLQRNLCAVRSVFLLKLVREGFLLKGNKCYMSLTSCQQWNHQSDDGPQKIRYNARLGGNYTSFLSVFTTFAGSSICHCIQLLCRVSLNSFWQLHKSMLS